MVEYHSHENFTCQKLYKQMCCVECTQCNVSILMMSS